MEVLEGRIDRIIYHKPSDFSPAGNHYLIAQFSHGLNGSTESSIIKGELNQVVYGWQYKLYGNWVDSDRGKAFVFGSFEPVIPRSQEGMADFLSRSVPEIGKVRARQIVDHFGDQAFEVLRTDPGRLAEIKGMTVKVREAVESWFSSDNALNIDPAAYARLYDLLSSIRPPRRVIASLLKNFGSNAPQFIAEHPYKLLDYPGMGWQRVDKFAIEVLKYNPKGIDRHERAIIEVLCRNSEYGHTKIDLPTLYADCQSLLGMMLVREALQGAIKDGLITIDSSNYVSSMKLYSSELSIADEIARLRSNPDPDLGFDLSDDILEDEQRLIPDMIRRNPVSIISGVPGSGKSTSISVIIKRLVDHGIGDILVSAPTGKASKRNDELIRNLDLPISVPCMTIHRALGGKPSSEEEEGIPEEEARMNRGRKRFAFEYNKENQLPYKVFIVDESSMLDISLGSQLLEAIPDDARIIFVGDRHQLPSVGPGSFLRDLLAAGIPSVMLEKPRRNSGTIAQSCYWIKEGKNPDPSRIMLESEGQSNWTHLEVNGDEKILRIILDIHANYIGKNSRELAKRNLQVVSPEKKNTLGCNNLNRLLGSIVNPSETPLLAAKHGTSQGDEDTGVRTGDKIVRLKNNLVKSLLKPFDVDDDLESEPKFTTFDGHSYIVSQAYVVNGDGGEVVGFKGGEIVVRFSNPDRLCLLPKSDSRIGLAYALTVHKCQGSGFPIIIMPLTDFYWNSRENVGLFSRELLYTAFSRPQERLITVGRIAEAYKAISRVTVNYRKTRLIEMIKNAQVI